MAKTQKSSLHWKFLKPGDLIDVVAPGSGVDQDIIQESLSLLTQWGFKARFSGSFKGSHPFHSDEDEVRLKYLWQALQAKDSKAIWCLRGGYGCLRLIPELLKKKVPLNKKLLIGYSDITTLHLLLGQKWKWPSLHGPLLENLRPERVAAEDLNELKKILVGEKNQSEFPLHAQNKSALKLKKTSGRVTGGNLAVLVSSLGTELPLKTAGKFLVLEDIGERGYRIDRLLEQLRQSKSLNQCRGILFGEFLNGAEKDGQDYSDFAIQRFAEAVSIPIFKGLQMGHGKRNRAVALFTKAELFGGPNSKLVVQSGGEQ